MNEPGAVAGSDAPLLGRLGRTYQLQGALRCYPEGEVEAELLRRSEALLVEGQGLLKVRFVRPHAGAFVVAFQGYRTPERAQALVNAEVRLDPGDDDGTALLSDARPLRPGLQVLLDGLPFGEIEEVLDGPRPLARVRGPGGTHLVPLHAPYVHVHRDRLEVVDPPPGLLDEPERA